jgi:hypothetical protein
LTSGFNAWGIKDFKKWAITFHQEQKGDKIVGFNLDPAFKNPGSSNLTGAYQILNVYGYEFSQRSVLKKLFGGNLPQVGMSKRTAF